MPSSNQRKTDGVWHGLHAGYRVGAGVVSVMALTPLFLALFTHDTAPAWEQWLAAAIFTPMALIGGWIVITGQTTISRSPAAEEPAAAVDRSASRQ